MKNQIKKILGLRIFEDTDGKMNLPIGEKMGILVVSQFTLHGNLKKGFRPSFNRAAPPALAVSLYHRFIDDLYPNGWRATNRPRSTAN